jgi:membrane-associated phospholipid phosphatase
MFIPIFNIKNVKAFGFGLTFLGLITSFIFLFFPGTMSRPLLDASVFGTILSWVYFFDAPHNLFPSTHVSFTFFTSLILHKNWIYVWFALICFSTLLTKQHYFLDVISGLVAGAIAFAVYKRF